MTGETKIISLAPFLHLRLQADWNKQGTKGSELWVAMLSV